MDNLSALESGAAPLFSHEFKSEAAIQSTLVAPAVAASAFTLNQWVALATLAYVVLQIVYLLCKWRREWLQNHARSVPEASSSRPVL